MTDEATAEVTVAEAREKIETLKGDAEFRGKLFNRQAEGHHEATQRWEGLHAVAHPEGSDEFAQADPHPPGCCGRVGY